MPQSVTIPLFDLMRPIIDANRSAVIVVDARSTILLPNLAAQRLFGRPRDDFAGKPLSSLFAATEQSRLSAFLRETSFPEGSATPTPTRSPVRFLGRFNDETEFAMEVGIEQLPASLGAYTLVTFLDLREQLQLEEALRHFEASYQSLIESLPLNVFRKDLQGRFVFVNQRFCDTVRKTQAELVGRTDFDLFPRELAEKYVSDDRKVIESGHTLDDVEEHRESVGTTYVQVLKAPVRNADGVIIGIQGMFWDVTEKRRAEHERREAEARQRAIFEAALDCIITVDHHGRIAEFNRAAERTFGYRREEVVGQPVDSVLFPVTSQERYRSNLERYSASREEGSLVGKRHEIPARRKNGSQFLAEMAMQPISLQGKMGFTVFLRDVTERRRAEDALRRSDARFRSLVQSNIIGIMICRLDGLITEANDAFLGTVGYTREELLNGRLRWDDMTPSDHRLRDEQAIQELTEQGTSLPWEKEYIRKDGERVPVLLGVTMLEGSRNHCLCFVLDMTAQKRQERELQAAKEAADAANRAKSAFLASMSHEIRTPIHAVLGATDLVLDSRLNSDQRDYLNIVRDSGESLLSLINDVLDFSKIEAGRLDVDEAEFHLRDAIGGTLKTLAVPAHTRGLELVADVRPSVPERVIGDVSHLRQILTNLVGNAIKFTDHGEVVVQVDSQDRDDAIVELQVAVRDTGVGIPPQDIERIFDPFEQGDKSMKRKVGGTGLGLAISSRLVESMQGGIWCESELGKGTTFHFTVQLKKAGAESELLPSAAAALKGLEVLIIDDNAACRQSLADMFACWNSRVRLASGRQEAFSVLQELQESGRLVQLLLVDSRMPSGDGFALAHEIHQRFGIPKNRILMLLTSGDATGEFSACERLQLPAYLMKPVNQSELFDTLMALLLGETLLSANGREIAEEQRNRPQGLEVLLTEDSLYNQKLATAVLQKQGHRVTIANHGKEAVALVKKRAFDVVLMDVQMPEMDGLEAARTIRNWEASTDRHVPIIAMTAQALKGDREKCLGAGMDEYLTKPVRAAELHSAIQKLTSSEIGVEAHRLVEQSADRLQSPVIALPQPDCDKSQTPKLPSGSSNEDSRINWAAALEASGGDIALMRDVIEAFEIEAPQRLQDLVKSVESHDVELFRRTAHTLKGGFRFLGVSNAEERFEQLERNARIGTIAVSVEDARSIQQEILGMLKILEQWRKSAIS